MSSDADPFDAAEVRRAAERSVLARLAPALRDAVLEGAVRSELPAGRFLYDPPLGLVVAGMLRVSIASYDGRRFAVSYLRSGDMVGLDRLAGRRFPLDLQTVTDVRLLRLSRSRVEELRSTQPTLGLAVAEQLARHLDDMLHETTLAAFGSVRERVLRHLLTLAVVRPGDKEGAVCEITHQQLADAVGAVRETVARALTDLRHEGLLGGDHRRIVIPDPARLRAHLTSVARHPTRRSDQSHSDRDEGHTLDDGGH